MTIEEEIERALIDVALENNWFDVVVSEDIAAALMPLARKAQAEALREAAVKAQEAFVAEQSGIGYARVRADWLHAEARRIEQNSEGNET